MANDLIKYQSPAYEPQPKDFFILHLAMVNTPVRDISLKVNEPQSAIKALLKGPWAQDQIARYHERFLSSLQQRAFDHTKAFEAKLEERIKQLDDMSRDENANVRLRAIELWLSHCIGSPVKRTEITHKSEVDGLSPAELRFVVKHKRRPTEDERMQLAIDTNFIDGELVEE